MNKTQTQAKKKLAMAPIRRENIDNSVKQSKDEVEPKNNSIMKQGGSFKVSKENEIK